MTKRTKFSSLSATLALAIAATAPAATVIWDGGGGDTDWNNAANWGGDNPDTLPAAGDTVIIGSGNTVAKENNLPGGITLNLDGVLTNAGLGAIRMNGATITVGSTGEMAGGFWDLDDATITFENGAKYTAGHWENKDVNAFTFELGASGFSTLTPANFWIGAGATHNPGSIVNASYTVDMAAYAGGTGVITLVDYGTDNASMDNATFQTATLNVINAGGYTANLQWNETTEAVELNVTGIPEPSSVLLLGLGGVALAWRRRPG